MSSLYMRMPQMGGGGVLGSGTYVSNRAASTATEAAFGPAATTPGQSGGLLAFLMPNDATGIAHWGGLLSLVGLLFLHHSLPR